MYGRDAAERKVIAIAGLVVLLLSLPALLNAEDIVVSSRFTDNILRFDAVTGVFKGVFASGSGMANPNGLAIGPDGRLYVALGDMAVVMRNDAATGAFIDRFVFDDPATTADETGGLVSPRGIAFGPEGDLYVASGEGNKVIRYDGRTGKLVGTVAEGGGLRGPVGVAVRADGTVIVGGALSNGVYVYRNNTFVRRCAAPAQHATITGVLRSSDGRLFAATAARNTVLRVDIETCDIQSFAGGGGLATGIYMAYDGKGNLLVGSFLNDTVIRFDSSNGQPLGQVMPSGAGGLDGTHAIAVLPEPQESFTPQLMVPGVARVAGSGSFFRTTMWVTNPSDSTAKVRLRFRPGAGFGVAGAIEPAAVTIAPHGMAIWNDVLSDAFRVSADTAGVVVIETAEGSPIPLVTARTFNDTAQGTFGQYIQALPLSARFAGERWIHGLAADANSRTNIGLVNLSDADAEASVSLWSPAQTQLGSDVGVVVPAGSSIQINAVQNAAGAGSQPEFSVRLTGPSPIAMYASKLDNKTSDPIFIVPLEERTEAWIDGIGAVPGAGGTFFRSTLSIGNTTALHATVTVEYTRRGETSLSRTAIVSIPAGQQRFFNDAVTQLLGLDNTAGMLAIRSNVPTTAWARTYNDRGEAGTLGQFIPSFGKMDLIGARGAILQGLSENDQARTNAGFANVSNVAANVTAMAFDASGSNSAQKMYRVEAGQAVFISRIFADLGIAPRSNMYLKVSSDPAATVYAWASYVDNASTDQTFVRPLPVP